MTDVPRYRWVTRSGRKGRWCASIDAAKAAAARAGHGHVDRQGFGWLDVFTSIETEKPG